MARWNAQPPASKKRLKRSKSVRPISFAEAFHQGGQQAPPVHLNDVRFIEVEGKYSAIHVGERKYNVKASLKDLLLKLPQEDFVRVSRNFVINIDRVTHIDTFQFVIRIDEDEIPISRT